MKNVVLAENLSISCLVHGHWRLADWNITDRELLTFTQRLTELGITTFDHADIYGNHVCEKLFGDAISIKKGLRNSIEIVTKCGIKLATDKFPDRKIKIYDYSYDHIISSVETSLSNFRTDYIDLLLLHRPAPFFDPGEVAKAFSYLRKSGKVLQFGVSNFNPQQFSMLSSSLNEPLVTNQVEISPYCLENFENGNIDFFMEKKIAPMAWSPLAGGRLIVPEGKKEQRLFDTLIKVAEELNVDGIDKIIFAWLLKHPANIIPIVGSGKLSRIISAIEAFDIDMTLEQWYSIYIASTGEDLP